LHDMLLAAHHAADVVQSVKELAVSDHRVLVETDIGHSLREAVSLLKDLLKKVDIQLDIGDLPRIRTNPGELLQIWVNLIKNAAESLLTGGVRNARIRIGARYEENAVKVSVADNGPGIPPDLLPAIFQPNVTTKIKGLSFGLGLGLSIVQRIVQHYGGQIEVRSRPGETVFLVVLPVEE
jgi:signal transduction histidine kinase